MKKWGEIALGIATSIGGFLDVGSIATSAQAGARYGFQLLWAVGIGTLCLIFLTEMSGRLAAVSRHTVADAVRERFGARVFVFILAGVGISSLLVLGAEIGGTCLALQLATGISFQWWAIPVALLVWIFLWYTTFGVIDNGIALLSLITVAFVVATVRLHPPVMELTAALVPRMPSGDHAQAGYLAVSILGASLTPYLFYFYSSGAVEDKWDKTYVGVNRVVSAIGMSFGGLIAGAVLIVAALVYGPRGITVNDYSQTGMMLAPLGKWGFPLFVASLFIACFGSALEVALTLAYFVAQGLGWNWGENLRPRQAARFAMTYTGAVVIGTLFVLIGTDPLKLTNVSMVLSAATLPLLVVPFLFIMNDKHYMKDHTNGWISNGVVVVVTLLAFVLAVISLPLEILGS